MYETVKRSNKFIDILRVNYTTKPAHKGSFSAKNSFLGQSTKVFSVLITSTLFSF